MPRRKVTLKIMRLDDPEPLPEDLWRTPGERMAMVWQITVDAYAFRGIDVPKSPFRRDIVRVFRRRR